MEEITELDMDKYLVLKQEDIDTELSPGQKVVLESIKRVIGERRLKKSKPQNEYLVLNLSDNVDIRYLFSKMALLNEKTRFTLKWRDIKIKDIAVDLVNAVLKVKE